MLPRLARPWLPKLAWLPPSRVQRLAVSALRRLERRWPVLARLVGRFSSRTVQTPSQTPPPPMPDATTTAALIAALRDRSAEVGVAAAESLRNHPPDLVAPALADVVANRDGFFDASTRAAAVMTLGAIAPERGLAPVHAALNDSDATVSLAAIAALVQRGDRGAADRLMVLLEDSTGFFLPITRQAAARGLSRVFVHDRERLRRIRDSESDSLVREALTLDS